MITLTVRFGDDTYTIPAAGGENLLALLTDHGITVYAPCRGNGTCGKCRVILRTEDGTEEVLACRTAVTADAEITVPRVEGGGLTDFARPAWTGGADGIGAAVDIGTTTVAVSLVDRRTGSVMKSRAALNPQQVCGADVISRISACGEGKLALQTDLIRRAVSELIAELCGACGTDLPDAVTVTGNPTMLHLFCGVDPTPIGTAPFTPVFTGMRTYAGADLSLAADTVFILPSASGYIGADVVCGILSLDREPAGVCLLADLGTNGELALRRGDAIYCAATAAGPALEGANIEYGIGGVAGAISAVSLTGGSLAFETVDGKPPVGICGSGLTDLIAVLLDCGIIDETGGLDADCGHPLAEKHLRDDRFWITDTVFLSQKDIRQFQLAKAAIHAGILTLCEYAGVDPDEVETLYVAGGLGFYLRQESALRTGLIPRPFAGKIRAVGNSGLAGAAACLSPDARDRAAEIADSIRICELNGNDGFAERFVDGMSFE